MKINGKNLKQALQGNGITQEKAAKMLGISRQTLSTWYNKAELEEEILQNVKKIIGIDLNQKEHKEKEAALSANNIPMYNFPASASNIEMYGDPNDIKIVGHLNIPGATKYSFALPVYGHSMYPTLENGAWCVLRPIEEKGSIVWGEIYYIEWGDYRMFKRLLSGDKTDEVILWSDNQSEKIGERPKYSPITIKKDEIRKLCLLTDILKKPNY